MLLSIYRFKTLISFVFNYFLKANYFKKLK